MSHPHPRKHIESASGRPAGHAGRTLVSISVAAALAAMSMAVQADGSRDLYPEGYFIGEPGHDARNGNAGRAKLNLNASNVYAAKIPARTFIYVHAKAGESILLGRSGTGNISIYAPDPAATDGNFGYGVKGNEAPAMLPTTIPVAAGAGSPGQIADRAAELAGPGTAAGGVVGNQFVPAVFVAPADGVYGVLLGVTIPDGELDHWDVSVRASSTATANISGRVFTYAYAARTGNNNNSPANEGTRFRLYSTLYYVTSDGYRYSQQLTGLDPNAFVLYSNALGFLDGDQPLYKNVVGSTNYLDGLVSGVSLQQPQYPIFFNDIAPSAGSDVDSTLAMLGIPLSTTAPSISNVGFAYPPGSTSHSYVGLGGTIAFDAVAVTTYQIVLSADGVDWDPENPFNKVLSGTASSGTNQVVWDGRANNGTPFAANNGTGGYQFRVVGRGGEAHFPFLDAEKNFNGGPIVTKLNPPAGSVDLPTTVYYDDRAYVTRSGVAVGYVAPDGTPGHLCGGTINSRHITTPYVALGGVDSAAVIDTLDYGGGVLASRYARYWGAAGNNVSGCGDNTQFGDRMGLDLWVNESSVPAVPASNIFIFDRPDVTTTVTVPATVAPGATVVAQLQFGNVGSQTAPDVTYSAQLPAGLSGVVCTGATCIYDPASGQVAIHGLPLSLSAGQWVPAVTLSYTAPASGNVQLRSLITTSATQAPDPGHATDEAAGATLVGGVATTADVAVDVAPPASAVVGQTVQVPVTFRNFGPLPADNVTYTVTLPTGLSGISCAPAVCSAQNAAGEITITLPATLPAGGVENLVLRYTAPSDPGVVAISGVVGTSTNEGGATANNTDSASTVIIAAGSPDALADVTVSISPPATAIVGETVTVPVRFENKGPAQATGVTYTVTVPSGVTPVCASCSVSGNTVTFTGGPGTLGSGESWTTSFTYQVPPVTSVAVTGTIGTATTQSNTGNDSATSETRVLVPDVVTRIGTITPPVGGVVRVPVNVTNEGEAPAQGVTYSVTLPPGATGVSCSVPCSIDGTGKVTIDSGGLPTTLTPGQLVSYEVRYTVPAGGTGGPASIVAETETTTPEPNKTNNVTTAAVASVAPIPVLGPLAMGGLAMLMALVPGFAARRRKQRDV